MDIRLISQFLKDLRKEKNMTQSDLAEVVGVTNKTVSRWETGVYLPPIDCLKQLSEIYNVSINEIISGKRLSEEEFAIHAEENIESSITAIEINNKRIEKYAYTTISLVTIIAIAILLLLPNGANLSSIDRIKEVIIIVLTMLLAFIANTLSIIAIFLTKYNTRLKKKES